MRWIWKLQICERVGRVTHPNRPLLGLHVGLSPFLPFLLICLRLSLFFMLSPFNLDANTVAKKGVGKYARFELRCLKRMKSNRIVSLQKIFHEKL